MTVYPVAVALADQYKGIGHALVGLIGGQVAEITYIRDLMPSFDESKAASVTAINDFRVGGQALKMQQRCELVSICMMSSWEAVEL